ncbi:peptide-methionine (R)-S-oxide reductase MsrB [Clostridiales bacterium BAD-6]|uniref:Peptide methionine sulfoxide reductase MsrA n=2 Tax=Sinanaerobacter chloroacetimidivorans TaxID=2818044 RepID=A0A8J7W6H5_9FIRM|nr:peptide-methionine (R)-S-oxide reductase MsrB [Sinanaerobacter chloroacetimidivorans]
MSEQNRKEIYLAGGCFWGLQKFLDEISGVLETEVGYANGRTQCPTYEAVCYSNTGHAETVKVIYDSAVLSLTRLLSLYYKVIDPTALNRQGHDVGSQYRTGIYYVDPEDQPVIRQSLDLLQKEYQKPIAVELKPLENYSPAEEYHQKYLNKNPGGYCHIGAEHFDLARNSIVDPMDYQAASDGELKEKLSPLQYDVTMKHATEAPYANEYWNHYEEGIYVDITTGEPLFTSKDKFEACGWPSFSKPIDPGVVKSRKDRSLGMVRDEVSSRVGNAHLGHVFQDGPMELGGMRYCINSASLRFVPKDKMAEEGYAKYLSLLEE